MFIIYPLSSNFVATIIIEKKNHRNFHDSWGHKIKIRYHIVYPIKCKCYGTNYFYNWISLNNQYSLGSLSGEIVIALFKNTKCICRVVY